MSDRNDLRRQTREIHEALNRFDREQLVDILTHIFRLYVMEGAALIPPPATALGDELSGVSFAQLIERLQLRLDLPELQLFEVQNNRVSLRIDGRLIALEPPVTRTEAPAVARPPVATSGPSSTPETRPGPVPAASPPQTGPAGAARPEAAARPAAARVAAPAAPSGPAANRPNTNQPVPPPAPKTDKPAEDNDQGGRFGLLEID